MHRPSVRRVGGARPALPVAIAFYEGGRFLTESGPRSAAYILDHGQPHMRGQLHLSVGECVYGLGERFTPFVKNGQVVDIWNRDGGTGSEQAYKNVPFYITNRGLRRVRQRPGPGLVRGRLRGGVPGAVQRRRASRSSTSSSTARAEGRPAQRTRR